MSVCVATRAANPGDRRLLRDGLTLAVRLASSVAARQTGDRRVDFVRRAMNDAAGASTVADYKRLLQTVWTIVLPARASASPRRLAPTVPSCHRWPIRPTRCRSRRSISKRFSRSVISRRPIAPHFSQSTPTPIRIGAKPARRLGHSSDQRHRGRFGERDETRR